jgi:hypothetical protein
MPSFGAICSRELACALKRFLVADQEHSFARTRRREAWSFLLILLCPKSERLARDTSL